MNYSHSSLAASDTDRRAERVAAQIAASRAEARVDAGLVRRANGGDVTAFEEIVRRHRGRLFSIVHGCLRDRADVEEVVDDAFARAHRGLARFRGDSSLATWLHRIALNLARNRYWYLVRRRCIATSLDAPLPGGATLGEFAKSDAPDPRTALDQLELRTTITRCFGQLSAAQQHILTLRAELDRSYGEIAIILGVSVGTVKSRIARAREQLRKQVSAVRADAPTHEPPGR